MTKLQKFLILVFLVLSTNLAFAQKLVILHTNDMHSKLTGFGPEKKYTPLSLNDDETLGGFARMATIVKQEKAMNPNSVILCDAGDYLMGTIFQSLEPETGFQLNLMKEIGYDVITIGNHEFDFGADKLGDIYNSAIENGEIPVIVSSQLKFSETDKRDDKLEKLAQDKKILPYTIIEKNGLKIGFFGLLGEEAQMVTQAAYPVEFEDITKTAKKMVKILREQEKVDIIICLSHTGFYPDENDVMFGEDIELAKKVPDIDIIISGHTHVETKKYTQIGKTIIVQTGSYLENIGRLEIMFDNGKINVVDFKLIKLDDKIKGDEEVHKKIEDFKNELNTKFFKPFGYEYDKAVAETDFEILRGSYDTKKPGPMGNFLTEAILFYTNTFSTGTDVVLCAEGTVRENILKGQITPADIFRIAPLGYGQNDLLGYSLAKVYVYGYELKKLAELAIFAGKPGEDVYLYFAGIKIYYNHKKGFLNKVEKITLNGKEIDLSKKNKTLYSLTSNMYVIGFVGEVKKMSKGLIVIKPKDKNGNEISDFKQHILDFNSQKEGVQEGKEWIAMLEFLKSFTDKNNNGLPDVPDKFKSFENSFIETK